MAGGDELRVVLDIYDVPLVALPVGAGEGSGNGAKPEIEDYRTRLRTLIKQNEGQERLEEPERRVQRGFKS
jgi:hypothetical protein